MLTPFTWYFTMVMAIYHDSDDDDDNDEKVEALWIMVEGRRVGL